MIKLLNIKTRTIYTLSDGTALKWLKEAPETWETVKVGVLKGQPAIKVSEEKAEEITNNNQTAKEEFEKEEQQEQTEEVKVELNLEEMEPLELKALAQRLGISIKGNPKKETIIKKIKEKQGE